HSPTSTPTSFPYTTLFRSPTLSPSGARENTESAARCVRSSPVLFEAGLEALGEVAACGFAHRAGDAERSAEQLHRLGERNRKRRDRKSTRLHSSHQIISYA